MSKVNNTAVSFPIVPEIVGGISVPWEELGVAVDGPSQVSNLALNERDGKVIISFETDMTGQYTVFVRHNDADIQGTPVTIQVHKKDEEPPPPPEPVVSPNEPVAKSRIIRFKVPGNVSNIGSMTVLVRDGPDRPKSTTLEAEGNDIAICLDISKPGKYVIGVLESNKDIKNSPFTINVPPSAFVF